MNKTLHCGKLWAKRTFVVPLPVPGGQKKPAGHAAEHNDVLRPGCDPKRPASHGPEHSGEDRAGADPKRPGGQGAVHVGDVRAAVPPYKPTEQAAHTLHPDCEYRPGGHTAAVALVEPAGHAYPAAHGPSHWVEVIPLTDPYQPAAHSPLQPTADSPLLPPYVPALQLVQVLAQPDCTVLLDTRRQ